MSLDLSDDRLRMQDRGLISRAGAWGRLLPSWPLLVALLVFAQALAHPLVLLSDPDTYLHVAAGRWILLHHALPFHDPFSYTRAGARWVVHEWLSEVVLAAVYDSAGWSGLVLLTAGCLALTMALFTRFMLRLAEPYLTLVAAVLGAALVQSHLLARPHVLALPILVWWSAELFAARDTGRGPPWQLLPLMTLWANLHGSFLFGLALAGFLGAEAVIWPSEGLARAAAARRWGLFAALATVAAMLTPNGLGGLLEPFRILRISALDAYSAEWRSPDFQHFLALEIWILGTIGLGFLTGIKVPLSRLILLLGLVHESLQHARFAEELALVAPLGLAASLGGEIAARLRGLPTTRLTVGAMRLARPAGMPALALCLLAALAISWPLLRHPLVHRDDAITPGKALAAARRIGLGGPVFNSLGFGGYLILHGMPDFVDTRAELYGNRFLRRYLKAEHGDRKVLVRILDHYRVQWTLLRPGQGANLALDGLPGWREIYRDREAVIHARISTPRH